MKNDVLKIFGAFLLLIIIAFGLSASSSAINLRQNFQLLLGKNQTDLSLKTYGIEWTPDSHISYITFPDNKRRYFISGNQKSYAIESNSSLSLAETIKNNPVIKEVFGPDKNVSYRNGYSTIGSVVQADTKNPYHVYGFTQNEEQAVNPDGSLAYSNFTSTIGLLESFDGGLTWKDFGPVIRGDDYLTPGTKNTGAGQPSAIVKDSYIYVYFIDWAAQIKTFHADQIYLARTKIEANGTLSAFEFYTTSGFSSVESNLVSVITVPFTDSGYAALPSVSYNKDLGKYIAVFEVNTGFAVISSADGLSWTKPKIFFTFPQAQSAKKTGDTWYSYPNLLSDKAQNSDQITRNAGNFYFSKGVWPNTAHQLTVTTFNIK